MQGVRDEITKLVKQQQELTPMKSEVRIAKAVDKHEELTIDGGVQVVIGSDGSFTAEELKNFKPKGRDAASQSAEIHDHMKARIEEALNNGDLTKIDPRRDSKNPAVSHYQSDGGSLKQEKQPDGNFKFTPEKDFTGILRVERKGPDGKLMKDSVDIIEYKNGKPISVIPGTPPGVTRVADFKGISREAEGIKVSQGKPVQDITVATSPMPKLQGFPRKSQIGGNTILRASVTPRNGGNGGNAKDIVSK